MHQNFSDAPVVKDYDYERAYRWAMERTPLRWQPFEAARAYARGFAMAFISLTDRQVSQEEFWSHTTVGMFR